MGGTEAPLIGLYMHLVYRPPICRCIFIVLPLLGISLLTFIVDYGIIRINYIFVGGDLWI